MVGGVTRLVDAPHELLLRRYDGGRLHLAGRTSRLHLPASSELGALLRPTAHHPWPQVPPPHRFGSTPTAYTFSAATMLATTVSVAQALMWMPLAAVWSWRRPIIRHP